LEEIRKDKEGQMMLYQLNEYKDKKIEDMYNKAIKELNNFYEIESEYIPSIIFVDTRKDYDKINCMKTESWQVGCQKNSVIYIISHEKLESESNHNYSDTYYFQLIKHELSHYYYKLYTYQSIPWINEGLANYSSGQYTRMPPPIKFEKFLKYISQNGKDIYHESGYVIKLLIDKYGKQKLFELLKKLTEYKKEQDLFDFFKEIYGFKLSYENMNKLLAESDDK
jgi:hypothetical protein